MKCSHHGCTETGLYDDRGFLLVGQRFLGVYCYSHKPELQQLQGECLNAARDASEEIGTVIAQSEKFKGLCHQLGLDPRTNVSVLRQAIKNLQTVNYRQTIDEIWEVLGGQAPEWGSKSLADVVRERINGPWCNCGPNAQWVLDMTPDEVLSSAPPKVWCKCKGCGVRAVLLHYNPPKLNNNLPTDSERTSALFRTAALGLRKLAATYPEMPSDGECGEVSRGYYEMMAETLEKHADQQAVGSAQAVRVAWKALPPSEQLKCLLSLVEEWGYYGKALGER